MREGKAEGWLRKDRSELKEGKQGQGRRVISEVFLILDIARGSEGGSNNQSVGFSVQMTFPGAGNGFSDGGGKPFKKEFDQVGGVQFEKVPFAEEDFGKGEA